MPTPQAVELHHNPNARFQSGNRVYRIVILGQGGVGKSGKISLTAVESLLHDVCSVEISAACVDHAQHILLVDILLCYNCSGCLLLCPPPTLSSLSSL